MCHESEPAHYSPPSLVSRAIISTTPCRVVTVAMPVACGWIPYLSFTTIVAVIYGVPHNGGQQIGKQRARKFRSGRGSVLLLPPRQKWCGASMPLGFSHSQVSMLQSDSPSILSSRNSNQACHDPNQASQRALRHVYKCGGYGSKCLPNPYALLVPPSVGEKDQ